MRSPRPVPLGPRQGDQALSVTLGAGADVLRMFCMSFHSLARTEERARLEIPLS